MKEVGGTSRDEYPDTELDIVPTLFSEAPPVRLGCIKSTKLKLALESCALFLKSLTSRNHFEAFWRNWGCFEIPIM